MSPRGNPKLQVRLDPELMERAQPAFPAPSGRSGGVALAVRQLLHLVLDEPIPEQYGEVRRAESIDKMEDRVRRMENGEEPATRLATSQKLAVMRLANAEDPVDKLRLYAVLGRLRALEMGQE